MIVGGQLTREQQRYLKLMGITVWLDRNRPAELQMPVAAPVNKPTAAPMSQPAWETLQQQVAACTR